MRPESPVESRRNTQAVGDIVLASPSGRLDVLYRKTSGHNTLFVTNRCNSNCVMCPQPSSLQDDSHLIDVCKSMIPLMDQATQVIGITGGEPTLIGDDLHAILVLLGRHLPNTSVHILTNGRLFASDEACECVKNAGCNNLVLGVPLYGDTADDHDAIVQAQGGFDQTVRGIHQLNKRGIAIELRIVMMNPLIERLPKLAEFIWYNFPFLAGVCFMGYEPMGYGWTNRKELWSDPFVYQVQLKKAVHYLANFHAAD